MNAKISVFIICLEAIIYLLLYNLQDCTFKFEIKVKFEFEFKVAVKVIFSFLSKIIFYPFNA